MIDFLRGTVAHREADWIALDVQGVGYRVFCPNPYEVGLEPSNSVMMYIHYHVREDANLLYGFPTREEQTLFRKLLDVSGIGPKVALGILSAGRPDAVASAIYQEDLSFLTRLPGIGKKTAQRIILDLKDKLGELATPHTALADVSQASRPTGDNDNWSEAKEVLQALGYTEAEVDRIWPQVRKELSGAEGSDILVKAALKAMLQAHG